MRKRVLITGASGFIGRHTVSMVKRLGYDVAGASLHGEPCGLDVEGVEWHRCDLLDGSERRRVLAEVAPTHLLHLAWHVDPRDYRTSLLNFRWVEATLDLAMAFAGRGGERAVFAGTCFEYDLNHGFCSESLTPLRPTTPYAVCKKSLSELLEALARSTGLSVAWGRIFFVYGPHEHPKRFVASVIVSLLRNEPAMCSHGNQIRDFLHVKDVAGALVSLLDSEVTGPVNIASGQPVPLREIASRIGAFLGRQELLQFGAVPALPEEVPLIAADVRRLTEEVGWRRKYDLDLGIRETLGWWERNL